jgi:two-component system, OmpR family, response regulator
MSDEILTVSNNEPIRLFFVDDDAVYLKSLEIEFLQHPNLIIETFATGELCLDNLHHHPDVIVLDYHLNGVDETAINGIETLDRIKAYNADIPVVMLSSQDKIDVAINCMHHKATDYVVKSETAVIRLLKAIDAIYQTRKIEKLLNWYMSKMYDN